jgi:hypothetical protein
MTLNGLTSSEVALQRVYINGNRMFLIAMVASKVGGN